MPETKALHLQVRNPWGDYEINDVITSAAEVKRVLKGPHQHDVLKVFAPDEVDAALDAASTTVVPTDEVDAALDAASTTVTPADGPPRRTTATIQDEPAKPAPRKP